VTLVSTHSIERDVRMAPGDSVTEGAYTFVFLGVSERKGPNYVARRGDIEVLKNGASLRHLHPEKRIYNVQRNTMTEAAIDPGLFRDLYVALGEPLEDGQSWAVRVYHKPFIRWLWLGAIFMGAGAALSATDRRYRMRKTTAAPVLAAGEKA
jgi:cytochrome c-type biogenesis protein CcmF